MELTIYEVVSGGTKKHHPPGGEDWSVLVAARSPTEARDIAYAETEIGRPWVIYEWGVDARASGTASRWKIVIGISCGPTFGRSGAGPRAYECNQDLPSRIRSRPLARSHQSSTR